MSTESTTATHPGLETGPSGMSTNSNVKITLHWLDKSRAHRILWLLEELKLDYELKIYKRQKNMLAPPELKNVHPLGKSPVVEIQALNTKPLILAESGAIIEYLTEHFGKWLVPKRYQDGKESKVGAETEEWLRYRFFMHYGEGSVMIYLIVFLIVRNIRNAPVPFFIRPITNGIANKISSNFVEPNVNTHFGYIEKQLETSPNGGDFLCGKELTGADILMIFPVEAARLRLKLGEEKYPKLYAYSDKIREREAYKRAVKRIEDETGEPYEIVQN
ncbi:putative glutathione S-transferase [Patellaria atrata CBS 101060]|uniref:glutathione transferase n=1 Tax=Patellaria atrata CBS 101060 TaxID=1346257 RepID=A0A9P4VTT4_9PEZI|nr:putative glutathione S-transferase [Patellaria atrata CBS 101060]